MFSRRLKFAVVLVVALLLAPQLFHHDALSDGSGPLRPCSVCAFGAYPLVRIAPVTAAAPVVAFLLPAYETRPVAPAARITLPSRAPPTC